MLQYPGRFSKNAPVQTGAGLHGGFGSRPGSFYFSQHGKITTGQLTVAIILKDQPQGEGGLSFIPGSHKQSTYISGKDLFQNLLNENPFSQCVVCPKLVAGDLVIFPETLVHGGLDWYGNAEGEKDLRRNIYYSYFPSWMCWRPYDEIKKYLSLAQTDLQKKLLLPPAIASLDDTGQYLRDNFWKGPTL